LTGQQPDNNLVRVAIQALAAVLGGTQSLHCNSRDEALALPTEESAKLALRTQQLIAAETGVVNTVDPCGGAYAIEEMTDQIEEQARALLERIDAVGGTLAAIEQGMIQREIQESAYRAQQEIDRGDRVVVGVNRFVSEETASIDVLRIDPEIEVRQIERVRAVRSSRDARQWQASLDRLAVGARDTSNLVPLVIGAVEARATLGEISDTLRGVFGEHKEIDV
jgi:methylmalonyl-CoA mutase N-terminal domain/subunit